VSKSPPRPPIAEETCPAPVGASVAQGQIANAAADQTDTSNTAGAIAATSGINPAASAAFGASWVNDRLNQLQADMLYVMAQNNASILAMIGANADSLVGMVSKTSKDALDNASTANHEIESLRASIQTAAEETSRRIHMLLEMQRATISPEEVSANVVKMIEDLSKSLLAIVSDNSIALSQQVGESLAAQANDMHGKLLALRGELSESTLHLVENANANVNRHLGEQLLALVHTFECKLQDARGEFSQATIKMVTESSEKLIRHVGDQLLAVPVTLDERERALTHMLSSSMLAIVQENTTNLNNLLGNRLVDVSLEMDRREQHMIEIALRRSAAATPKPEPVSISAPRSINPLSLDEAIARLRELAPLSMDAYLACLQTGTDSYEGLPAESCSTERHPQAKLFGQFLKPYLARHVLDVGCGPQPVPSYLADWPVPLITGLDPISRAEDHPFRFVSGFGEFIPFADESFGTVVSGTTLDHYYLLDRGLAEAFRVLEPGGHFVAWITEFTGAPAYDPYSAPAKPFDDEHMYHIDRAWFMPMMEKVGFVEVETLCLPLPFRYLFMSFRKPGTLQTRPAGLWKRMRQAFISER
jgi:SAM-dependent methyltransferase